MPRKELPFGHEQRGDRPTVYPFPVSEVSVHVALDTFLLVMQRRDWYTLQGHYNRVRQRSPYVSTILGIIFGEELTESVVSEPYAVSGAMVGHYTLKYEAEQIKRGKLSDITQTTLATSFIDEFFGGVDSGIRDDFTEQEQEAFSEQQFRRLIDRRSSFFKEEEPAFFAAFRRHDARETFERVDGGAFSNFINSLYFVAKAHKLQQEFDQLNRMMKNP